MQIAVTVEENPDQAVSDFLANKLERSCPMSPMPAMTMRTELRRPIWRLLLVCLLAGGGYAHADSGRLVVQIEGVKAAGGELRASLYQLPETFRKEDKALQVVSLPAQAGAARLVFDGLPAGRYAVMVYHDANSDQKLNLRFGMFPTEGYGLSNNPSVIGPPKFEGSAFDLKGAESRINIRLAY